MALLLPVPLRLRAGSNSDAALGGLRRRYLPLLPAPARGGTVSRSFSAALSVLSKGAEACPRPASRVQRAQDDTHHVGGRRAEGSRRRMRIRFPRGRGGVHLRQRAHPGSERSRILSPAPEPEQGAPHPCPRDSQYREGDIAPCLELLKSWRRHLQNDRDIEVSGFTYMRSCVENALSFADGIIKGEIITINDRICAFSLAAASPRPMAASMWRSPITA